MSEIADLVASDGQLPKMRTPDAAAYVGLSKRTLEKWRRGISAIPYHRLGRAIVYDKRDLDAFLVKNRHG